MEKQEKLRSLLPYRRIYMEELLSIDEVAKRLGYKKSYLYKLVWARAIPCYKPNNGRLLFVAKEINEWILRGKIGTANELTIQADALLNGRRKK